MDLVLGIDSSTTATKAIAWDREGRAVAEGRSSLPIADLGRGWMEQSVNDWWRSLGAALRDLFRQIDPARVAALAFSNQRETVGFLDEAGEEVRPAILWLDERCRPTSTCSAPSCRPSGSAPSPAELRPDACRVQPALADAVRTRALATHRVLRRRAGLSRLAPDRPARDELGQRRPAWPARPSSLAPAPRSWRSWASPPDQLFEVVRPGTVIGEVTPRCRCGHRAAARHARRCRWRRRPGRRLGHGHARRRQGLSQHRHGLRVRHVGCPLRHLPRV